MTQQPETVYVVDDDAPVRRSLVRLVESAGLEVVSYASSEEFMTLHKHKHPACLILDIRMPGINGLELQEHLAAQQKSIPIIFLTGHGDVSSSVKALKSGAVDFLQKPVDADRLFEAIQDALQKDRAIAEQEATATAAMSRVERLTPRELEVLRHVITGKLNKQIAADLGISEKTVKVHRGRVTEKLEVASVAEMVRLAEDAGVDPMP